MDVLFRLLQLLLKYDCAAHVTLLNNWLRLVPHNPYQLSLMFVFGAIQGDANWCARTLEEATVSPANAEANTIVSHYDGCDPDTLCLLGHPLNPAVAEHRSLALIPGH
jgi:hypothetical protein